MTGNRADGRYVMMKIGISMPSLLQIARGHKIIELEIESFRIYRPEDTSADMTGNNVSRVHNQLR